MEDFILQNYTSIPTESLRLFETNEAIYTGMLETYDSIGLLEMDQVKLMKRVDTKFIIPATLLPELLAKASEHYRVVEIDQRRILPYSSVYFDTPDANMYTVHHNGKLNRYKVRMRSYMTSGLSFLEIKDKNNKGVTRKERIPIRLSNFNQMTLTETENAFLEKNTCYKSGCIIPQLQNYFQRITLVDKKATERVTIDLGITFRLVSSGNTTDINGLVIVEMKQDAATKSYFRNYLNEAKIRPGSMSKYCLGMSLINPTVKNNSFKTKIRKINKITQLNYATN